MNIMTRLLHFFVFILGLAVACWIGASYVTSNPLALTVTILIGIVYLVGAFELYRYQQATHTLTQALAGLSEPLSDLDAWLAQLSSSLRNAVRLRIQGERTGLPGPSLAPYLVGLLVLLGMLGTFLGMVATLRGTGLALESATDLHAIRASMAEPVKGLGFAFGTSVAGVATSAMLGLLAALCRRERIRAAQVLDTKIGTTLRSYSLVHQREEQLRLLQRQSEAMPAAADQLKTLMTAMESQQQALNAQLLASQDAFQTRMEATYTRLVSTVEQSLKESVTEGARAAGAAIQPVAEATMGNLARENAALHDTIRQAVQQQLDQTSSRAEQALELHAASLVNTVAQSQSTLQAQIASQDEQRLAVWSGALTAITAETKASAQATITEIAQLLQTASEAPKAAAEVISELRQNLSQSLARDNTVLEERGRLLETVSTLLDAVNHAASEQRTAVDALVGTSADVLDRVSTQFTDHIQAETGKLTEVAAQLTGSAVDVASLGDTFGTAVQQFSQSNQSLQERLEHIEAALDKSMARSDEQLAYYVAQAREVVDLSILSQKQIIEELQQLAGRQPSASTDTV